MVDTDAYGGMVLAADVYEGHKARLYLLELLGILRVGILKLAESACGVDIVAGVDAHFLAV